jgi:hypothetical protein
LEAEEVASLVEELELRLERLRILYDQYFMGLEKIPPGIAHKDVERRIYVLRREKIRNTGIRFKFQTLIQRFNTLGSYWARILREIENGTYKRDVMRAKKRFGAPDAKASVRAVQLDELDVDSLDVDLDVDLEEPFEEPPAAAPPGRDTTRMPVAPPVERGRIPSLAPGMPGSMGMFAAGVVSAARQPAAPTQPAPPPRAAAPAPPAEPTLGASPPQPAGQVPPMRAASTALGATKPSAPAAARPTAAPASRATPTPPTRTIPARAPASADEFDSLLDEAFSGADTLSKMPVARPIAPPTTPRLPVAQAAPTLAPARPATVAPAPRPAIVAPHPRTAPVMPTPRPAPAAATMPAPPPARPAATIAPTPRPAAAAPAPTSKPGPAPGDDFRQVYARFVDARRQNGESTAGLTYEGLAKNLRETTAKLRDKSGGRAIDFDVVVKDGKTILKPVVK